MVFRCSVVSAGAYRIVNGTCAQEITSTDTLLDHGKCPQYFNVTIPCRYTRAPESKCNWCSVVTALLLAVAIVRAEATAP